MLDSDYAHAEVPKAQPEMPVRVFLNSQLIAALRQHARPIVIGIKFLLARLFACCERGTCAWGRSAHS